MCFSPYLGIRSVWEGGGGAPRGWVHNVPMQLFALDSSKGELFETFF